MLELPINTFLLKSVHEFIELNIIEVFGFPEQTSCFGGYEARGTLNLNIGCYTINDGDLYFTTGEIYKFYKELEKCYSELTGIATFKTYEGNLEIIMSFSEKTGHINELK